MTRSMKKLVLAFALIAGQSLFSAPANAGLVVTPAGSTDGFVLSLFVDQVPTFGCCGPLGMATNSAGQVVMQVFGNNNYVFNDVDGQHFSNALSHPAAAFTSPNYGIAITSAGGNLYAGNQDNGGQLFRLNPDGSVAATVPGTANAAGHGITTNLATGHVVSSSWSGIYDTNVTTGNSTLIVANPSGHNFDGVAVSADGKTIYVADTTANHVYGYTYAGVLVYDSGFYGGSLDGIGVIQGSNPFAGDLVANGNDGTVHLLDTIAHTDTIIASGGSRGDYVGVDSTNGSLFLTQSDSVYRLTCGPNCQFTTTNDVPEPASVALFGMSLVGLAMSRRRKVGKS